MGREETTEGRRQEEHSFRGKGITAEEGKQKWKKWGEEEGGSSCRRTLGLAEIGGTPFLSASPA